MEDEDDRQIFLWRKQLAAAETAKAARSDARTRSASPPSQSGAPREALIRKRAMLIVHNQLWQIDQDFSAYLKKMRVAPTPQARQRAWENFRARLAPTDALGGRWTFDAKTGQVGATTKLEKVFGVGEGN